jgi:hypothetical protein
MSDDLAQRLRRLPPGLSDPGDRFDRVRERVRRRRRLVTVAAASAVVAIAAGVPVGVILASGGPDRGGGPDGGAVQPIPTRNLSCLPGLPPDRARWVPQPPTDVDGRSRLAPTQPPLRALLCAYRRNRLSAGPGRLLLSQSRVLSGGLDRLAADLSWAPRLLAGEVHHCKPPTGQRTGYLIGLTYPRGTLWVSTSTESCTGTDNGEFTSPASFAAQVGAALVTGTWAPAPPPPGTTPRDPCRGHWPGRLGQETTMVPGDPISVRVCYEAPNGSTRSASTTVRTDYRPLVQALNRLPTRPTPSPGCRSTSPPSASYTLRFGYPQGPDVLVTVQPRCSPAVDNQSLQADDWATVLPEITRLLSGS